MDPPPTATGGGAVIREWLGSFRRAFGVRWEDRCVDNRCWRVWVWKPLGLGGWEMMRTPIRAVQGKVSYAGIREGGRVQDSFAFLLLLAVAIPAILGAVWAEGVGWALRDIQDPQKVVRDRWGARNPGGRRHER